METIITYINNIFAALPQSDELLKMKEELIASSQEKYLTLVSAGKSEMEALGLVIEQFGSLDDIKNELNITVTPPCDEWLVLEKEYQLFQKRYILGISGAIFLIIVGAIITILLQENHFHQAWPITSSLLTIGISVSLLIYLIMQKNMYEKRLNQFKYTTKTKNHKNLAKPYTGYNIYHAFIAMLWLLALASYLFIGFHNNVWHPTWLIFIIACAITIILDFFSRR